MFAKSTFALNKVQEDKATLRHHLEIAWKRTGKKPQQLEDAPDLPEQASHVWDWFLVLASKRQQAMAGIAPLLESEIGWFFSNRGITPEPWEIDAINALDRAAMEAQSAET